MEGFAVETIVLPLGQWLGTGESRLRLTEPDRKQYLDSIATGEGRTRSERIKNCHEIEATKYLDARGALDLALTEPTSKRPAVSPSRRKEGRVAPSMVLKIKEGTAEERKP